MERQNIARLIEGSVKLTAASGPKLKAALATEEVLRMQLLPLTVP